MKAADTQNYVQAQAMTNKLNFYFILFYFILFYGISLLNFWSNEQATVQLEYFPVSNVFLLVMLSYSILVLYKLANNNILYPAVLIKIMFFTVLCFAYFMMEQLLIKLSVYSIGDSGGWLRNEIYNDVNYVFQWYEVLFWNFIFSLHYPIYIYLFFRPFVNHLDKSIRKKRKEKGECYPLMGK